VGLRAQADEAGKSEGTRAPNLEESEMHRVGAAPELVRTRGAANRNCRKHGDAFKVGKSPRRLARGRPGDLCWLWEIGGLKREEKKKT